MLEQVVKWIVTEHDCIGNQFQVDALTGAILRVILSEVSIETWYLKTGTSETTASKEGI